MHRDENTWNRRFEILSAIEQAAIQRFTKLYSICILAYLIARTFRTEDLLQLKIQSYTVDLPAAYFFVTSSFLLIVLALSFCHLSVAMSLKIGETSKITIPGFSTNVLALLKGNHEDLSLGVSEHSSYSFKELIPVSRTLSICILLGLFSALVPAVAYGFFLISEQTEILLNSSTPLAERASSLLGLIIVYLSAAYVFLFHVPLPVRKNEEHIRWNILRYLHPHPHPHPQLDAWRRDEEK